LNYFIISLFSKARAAVIQYENRVLLDKMMDIERKKTNLNPEVIAKKSFHPTKTLNTTKRVKELRKINEENRVNFFSSSLRLFFLISFYL